MSLLELMGVLITAVAVFGYVNHRLIRLPDTIGITAMGLLLSLLLPLFGRWWPGGVEWARGFAQRLDLGQLVLHGLLGALVFAGSLHIITLAVATGGYSLATGCTCRRRWRCRCRLSPAATRW